MIVNELKPPLTKNRSTYRIRPMLPYTLYTAGAKKSQLPYKLRPASSCLSVNGSYKCNFFNICFSHTDKHTRVHMTHKQSRCWVTFFKDCLNKVHLHSETGGVPKLAIERSIATMYSKQVLQWRSVEAGCQVSFCQSWSKTQKKKKNHGRYYS